MERHNKHKVAKVFTTPPRPSENSLESNELSDSKGDLSRNPSDLLTLCFEKSVSKSICKSSFSFRTVSPKIDAETTHIEWIEYVRVITMFLVIIGHCSYYNIISNYGGINYKDTNVDLCLSGKMFGLIVAIIYSFHMPMFAMISGICFNWTLKKISSIRNLIINKFYRLLIPFIFTTFFISIPIKYITGYWKEGSNVIHDIFFGQIILGGNSHLWFLISLFNVFILSYLIGRSRIEKGKLYFTILFLISAISWNIDNKNWFGLAGAGKLLIFFETGRYYFYKINQKVSFTGKKIILNLFLFCFLAKAVTIHFNYSEILLLIPRAAVAFYGCFILIAFSKWIAKKNFMKGLFSNLDRDSLGMYLFSDPFNYVILAVACPILQNTIYTNNETYTFMFFARFLVTLLISILLTRLVRNFKI